jgi:hypothetical protein
MPSSHSDLTAHAVRPTAVPPAPEPLPACQSCGTDNFLTYFTYTPDGVGPDGYVEPAHVAYTCAHCGATDEHDVPSRWKPPGWFCCT